MADFFKRPGDLNANNLGNNYFKTPGDITKNKSNDYFKQAGELTSNSKNDNVEINHKENMSDIESIKDFLLSITSGKSYRYDENYLVLSGASTVMPISRIQAMYEEGTYNFISTELLTNPMNGEYHAVVKFEQIMKKENLNKSR